MLKKSSHILSMIFACVFTHSIAADEKVRHFPALAAPDTMTAICNLQNYNAKLVAITSKPNLTAEDMVKVHELTYTLENAIIRLKESLEKISIDLEDTHLASEALEGEKVKKAGERYLLALDKMINSAPCKN